MQVHDPAARLIVEPRALSATATSRAANLALMRWRACSILTPGAFE
jgi:hypothetical protein